MARISLGRSARPADARAARGPCDGGLSDDQCTPATKRHTRHCCASCLRQTQARGTNVSGMNSSGITRDSAAYGSATMPKPHILAVRAWRGVSTSPGCCRMSSACLLCECPNSLRRFGIGDGVFSCRISSHAAAEPVSHRFFGHRVVADPPISCSASLLHAVRTGHDRYRTRTRSAIRVRRCLRCTRDFARRCLLQRLPTLTCPASPLRVPRLVVSNVGHMLFARPNSVPRPSSR